jgi:hypothetical protein
MEDGSLEALSGPSHRISLNINNLKLTQSDKFQGTL